jgi:asparagine synthase (glutamine-hydrolysing)
LSALDAYLTYQYVPHLLSAFKAIRKLPPASTLTVSAEIDRVQSYWSLDYVPKLTDASPAELEYRVWEEINAATRRRLLSEVPLGAFPSGGLDSSAIVAAMSEQMDAPVKTFSIGFDDAAFDELRYARLVAQHFGTNHHEFLVEPDALETMPRLARHYGEPFGDPSAIPGFYLAELAKQHVTVALNGDGGDESFGGYEERYDGLRAPHLNWLPDWMQKAAAPIVGRIVGQGKHPSSTRTQIYRLAQVLGMSPPERYATFSAAFDVVRRRRLLTPEFTASVDGARADDFVKDVWDGVTAPDNVDRMLATDVLTYLPDDLLVKIDIATMAHSGETRLPLLDHELMEFAASIPTHHKVNQRGKALLRHALRDVLPPEVLTRPKMGFSVPLARWFRDELRELPADVLLDERCRESWVLSSAEVESLIREHRKRRADHSRRLWVLLQLEMWHLEVLDPPRPVVERQSRSS